MVIATLETEHYSWMAVGESESLAKELIAKAFRKHIRQYPEVVGDFRIFGWPRSNTDLITESDLDDYYSFRIFEGGSGTAWMDDQILIGRTFAGSYTERDRGTE